MKKEKEKDLLQRAHKAAVAAHRKSYSPYSKFAVGCAVVIRGGAEIYTGCNVENASYGATLCAERVAIFKAVSEGAKKFEAIVVVTDQKKLIPPCALCLQVFAEFFEPQTKVHLGNLKKIKKTYLFSALLSHPFGPSYLGV